MLFLLVCRVPHNGTQEVFGQMGPGQMGTRTNGPGQMGTRTNGPGQMGPGQMRPGQMDPGHYFFF